MSNADELRVSLVEEVTPGTTPTTPSMLVIPTTGQDLSDFVRYVESNTITSSRNVRTMARVGRSSGGSLPAELSWAVPAEALYLAIMAAMSRQTEDAENEVASCTTVVGTNTITRGAGDWTAGDAVKVNDLVRLTLGTAADMGYYVVTTVAPTTLGVLGATFTGSVGNVQVNRGARIDNGTYHRHFSIEISKLDIDQHHLFRKQAINTMDVSIDVGSISSMSFGITGGLSVTSGTEVGGSYTDPAVRDVMDAISVPLILIGGTEYEMSQLRLSLSNNAQAREKIGTDSVGTIRRGKFRVTGSAQWYHEGFTEYDKYLGNSTSSVAMVNEDSSGNAWSWHCPRMKFSSMRNPTTGPNSDDYTQAEFTALEATQEAMTMRLQRFIA